MMKLEDVQRVINLEACIKSAERNIEGYKLLKQAKEITIRSNDPDVESPVKYITGIVKNKIFDVLILEQQLFMDLKIAELEKI